MNPDPSDTKYRKPTSIRGTPAFRVTAAIAFAFVAAFYAVAYTVPYVYLPSKN